jgi:hypothetical protein
VVVLVMVQIMYQALRELLTQEAVEEVAEIA